MMTDVHDVPTPPDADEEDAVGVEQARPDTTTESTKTFEVVDGVTLTEAQVPLTLTFIGSIVLLIAVGAYYDWPHGEWATASSTRDYAAYAITIPSITMALSFFGLLVNKVSEDSYSKWGQQMNQINLVWAFIGACFLTFKEPFTETSNGYFASWAVVYGCAMAAGIDAKKLGSSIKGFGSLEMAVLASLVVVLASIEPIRDNWTEVEDGVEVSGLYNGEITFALILACVTFITGLGFMLYEKFKDSVNGMFYFFCIAILSVCWIVMACLVTFRGPFATTGNGYFGSWVGAMATTAAAFSAKKAL